METSIKDTSEKIKSLPEIEKLLEEHRQEGLKVVQCHGVFDLLHPGHIRHFKSARSQGDKLVVSVTPDRFVNKGPGRPAFNERLRLETIAALADVDYVVLNDTPDAVSLIRRLRPSVYVKGVEYKDHEKDVTGKIAEESQAVYESGGSIFYTDDIVFSSSSLLNRYFDTPTPEVLAFLDTLKKDHSSEEIIDYIEKFSRLKVLVIGDAIIDEYQYTEPLGQSGKGLHMVAKCLHKEIFLGGALIIASHLMQFAKEVTLLTAIGANCPHRPFIQTTLDSRIRQEFVLLEEGTTLTKKRYVLKDGKNLSKLFETYSSNEQLLNEQQSVSLAEFIRQRSKEFDLIVVSDFGNGLINPLITKAVSSSPAFLAINTQINSGNRGYNVITHYQRANFISLNEPELRLAAHDRYSPLENLAAKISTQLCCRLIAVTRGVNGVYCYSPHEKIVIPAIATRSVDRIGAGDAFLSLASLGTASHAPLRLAAFIGSAAAAMSVQMIGNQEPIQKATLCKFLTRLMK